MKRLLLPIFLMVVPVLVLALMIADRMDLAWYLLGGPAFLLAGYLSLFVLRFIYRFITEPKERR